MASDFKISYDLLPPTAHVPAFATVGVGGMLAAGASAKLLSDKSGFPFLRRGQTLVIVADFGGSHPKQHFDTYTFLILDPAQNVEWLGQQHHFRKVILPNKRRMSFKALNDGMRRSALVPFMRAAAGIEGCLVQFAISKVGGSLFTGESQDEVGAEILTRWKPNVQERLLRVLHLSAFLLSGLSAPNQDVLWVIDEDDIAANVALLTDLTHLFARVASTYISHPLGHLRCGTTATAIDNTLTLEDLAAIPDLTTGALGEVCTGYVDSNLFPRQGIFTPLPSHLTWKTKLISSWMAAPGFSLRRHTTILQLEPGTTRTQIKTLVWQSHAGSVILPNYRPS